MNSILEKIDYIINLSDPIRNSIINLENILIVQSCSRSLENLQNLFRQRLPSLSRYFNSGLKPETLKLEFPVISDDLVNFLSGVTPWKILQRLSNFSEIGRLKLKRPWRLRFSNEGEVNLRGIRVR